MSCLTPAQVLTVREEIGDESTSGFSDVDIETRADRLDETDPLKVALSILRERMASMRNNPAQWSLSGDYNENWSANMSALAAHISDLENRIRAAAAGVASDVPGSVTVTTAGLLQADGFRLGDYD